MSLLKNEFLDSLITIVLCAGEGKRLKKITKNIPKPLLKLDVLGNESILQNIIFKFIELGIKQIAIIIGHLGTSIENFISKLIESDTSLKNKIIIINSANQYKFGPLSSFLSMTKNTTIFKDKKCYLLVPGDTIFDINILKAIKSIISQNFELLQKRPFLFYRDIDIKRLREIHSKNKVISYCELDTEGSVTILKKISQLKIKNFDVQTKINEIIPVFALNYGVVNDFINLKEKFRFNNIWKALNYLIYNKKIISAFNIEKKYHFFDIDDEYDLKRAEKKRKGR